jgi:hypothetical protein
MSDVQILPSDEDAPEEKLEKLPQDISRPFSPPEDSKSSIPEDHPAYDSADADAHQAYDEGNSNAAETNDPGDRGIKDYDPSKGSS